MPRPGSVDRLPPCRPLSPARFRPRCAATPLRGCTFSFRSPGPCVVAAEHSMRHRLKPGTRKFDDFRIGGPSGRSFQRAASACPGPAVQATVIHQRARLTPCGSRHSSALSLGIPVPVMPPVPRGSYRRRELAPGRRRPGDATASSTAQTKRIQPERQDLFSCPHGDPRLRPRVHVASTPHVRCPPS